MIAASSLHEAKIFQWTNPIQGDLDFSTLPKAGFLGVALLLTVFIYIVVHPRSLTNLPRGAVVHTASFNTVFT